MVASGAPQQSGFATGKDVQRAAKYTNDQFKSIYKNMVTTTNGVAADATSHQNRVLGGMARLSARTEIANNTAIAKSTARQRNLFGAAMGGVINQKMEGARVNARAGRIQDRGNQAAASDLAGGMTQAIATYKSTDAKAMVAAQTGLAEQLKMYNNAIQNAQGSAKTVLANSATDGEYVNRIYNQVGKTLDRMQFAQNLAQGGYTDPNEVAYMWTAYQNMGRLNGDAAASMHAAATTIYGDQIGHKELNTLVGGVQGQITTRVSTRATDMAKQGLSAEDIARELVSESGMSANEALTIAQQAILESGGTLPPGSTLGTTAVVIHHPAQRVWDPMTGAYKNIPAGPDTTEQRVSGVGRGLGRNVPGSVAGPY